MGCCDLHLLNIDEELVVSIRFECGCIDWSSWTPIAIVGRSGLFKLTDLGALLENIVGQRDMTSEATAERWRLEPNSVLASGGKSQNTVRTAWGTCQ